MVSISIPTNPNWARPKGQRTECSLVMNQRLRNLRENNRFSQKNIAELLGISQSAYSQIEKGSVAISVDHLKALCKKYDVSMDWLAFGRGKARAANTENYIPLVSAGSETGYLQKLEEGEDGSEELDCYKIPGFEDGVFRIFEANGNSMNPGILAKDYLICSAVEELDRVLDGSACVVVEKDSIQTKRVFLGERPNGKMTLKSDNPAYKDYELDVEDVMELWLVNARLTSSFSTSGGDQEVRIFKLEKEFSSVKDQLSRLMKVLDA